MTNPVLAAITALALAFTGYVLLAWREQHRRVNKCDICGEPSYRLLCGSKKCSDEYAKRCV